MRLNIPTPSNPLYVPPYFYSPIQPQGSVAQSNNSQHLSTQVDQLSTNLASNLSVHQINSRMNHQLTNSTTYQQQSHYQPAPSYSSTSAVVSPEYVSISPVGHSSANHTLNRSNPIGHLNHVSVHSNNMNVNMWPCPSCEIPFHTAHELQTHLSTHTKLEKTVPCPRCGKLFATHERVKTHIRNSHNDKSNGPFYVKAHFSFTTLDKGPEISFNKGDIFHVVDTFQSNKLSSANKSKDTNNNHHIERLQSWLAIRVGPHGQELDKGLIPNDIRARRLAAEEYGDTNSCNYGRSNMSDGSISKGSKGVSFLKRHLTRRSKSLGREQWESIIFEAGSTRFPPYERVNLKHPGFIRPVVIFGPLADIARNKLLNDYPEKYAYPNGFRRNVYNSNDDTRPVKHDSSENKRFVIKSTSIHEIITMGKHSLLDITPAEVEKLNFAHLYPIVIFMKADSKSIVKEFRSRACDAKRARDSLDEEETRRRAGQSCRQLLDRSRKLEKIWSHVFTATLNLSTMGSEMWYKKLRETIEDQQSSNIWMSERHKQHTISSSNIQSYDENEFYDTINSAMSEGQQSTLYPYSPIGQLDSSLTIS